MLPPIVTAALVLALPALALVAAFKDATSYTIPNWVSLALIGVFPVAALAVGLPLPAFGLHLALGFAALVAGMIMFSLRWIGGGDAKLFAAAALWMGVPAILNLMLGAALAGGALAMILLLVRSAALRPLVLLGPGWVVRLAEPGEGVPYGVAIAAGAIWALPATPFAAALPGLGAL
jgi:prepilin peptidase CpaA